MREGQLGPARQKDTEQQGLSQTNGGWGNEVPLN
jgi:hypothetical protein